MKYGKIRERKGVGDDEKLTLFLLAIITFLGLSVQVNAEVDYSISHYDGVLEIHNDNSADFIQKITYQFDSSYNGQIVTLGEAGNMPAGFSVNSQPEISAEVNGTSREVDTRISNLGDGYEVKFIMLVRVVILLWLLCTGNYRNCCFRIQMFPN